LPGEDDRLVDEDAHELLRLRRLQQAAAGGEIGEREVRLLEDGSVVQKSDEEPTLVGGSVDERDFLHEDVAEPVDACSISAFLSRRVGFVRHGSSNASSPDVTALVIVEACISSTTPSAYRTL